MVDEIVAAAVAPGAPPKVRIDRGACARPAAPTPGCYGETVGSFGRRWVTTMSCTLSISVGNLVIAIASAPMSESPCTRNACTGRPTTVHYINEGRGIAVSTTLLFSLPAMT
jgi:hypothetical protein